MVWLLEKPGHYGNHYFLKPTWRMAQLDLQSNLGISSGHHRELAKSYINCNNKGEFTIRI